MNWHELSWQVRREVLDLAKAGRQHPDAQVAAAAYDWATQQAQSRWGRAADVFFEIASGIAAPGSADLSDMRQRFVAHRLVKLGPPAADHG